MKGLRWKRSASHWNLHLYSWQQCISGVGQNKPQGYVYFEVVCSSTAKCASRLHISHAARTSRLHFIKDACSSILHFVRAAWTFKDPCFSKKHVTKHHIPQDGCMFFKIAYYQGCMLLNLLIYHGCMFLKMHVHCNHGCKVLCFPKPQ